MVGGADEVGDEQPRRPEIHLHRRAHLQEPPLVHHRHPVGNRQRLFLVVGDIDGGDPQAVDHGADLGAQMGADLGVERRQRLVQQQNRRIGRQRPGQRHALLLAAGKLVGITVLHTAKPGQFAQLLDPFGDLALGTAPDAERETDVLGDGLGREQGIGLEDEPDLALGRRQALDPPAVDRQFTRIGLGETGDDAQQRRLAATAGADEGDELARGDIHRDVVHRGDVAEGLDDALKAQLRHSRTPPARKAAPL